MKSEILYRSLSDKILGIAFKVHSKLGPGLLESAYEGALCIELSYNGIPFRRQKFFPVYYRDQVAGAYFADLIVDNSIVLELKSVQNFNKNMEAQILNYLKLSKIKVGYLLNFRNKSVQWKRFYNLPRRNL